MNNPRRIITGNTKQGKSIAIIDDSPGSQLTTEVAGLSEIWSTQGGVMDRQETTDHALSPVVLNPPAQGTVCRYFTIAPEDPEQTKKQAESQAAHTFEQLKATEARTDSSRHSAMHKTQTIDYVVLLKGENVSLILDEEAYPLNPFDVVVQRGTSHAWANRGPEPALFLAVLVDAEIR